MVVVGTVILPHGALPFDGDKNSASEECRARYAQLEPTLRAQFEDLYEGTCRAGSTVASWEPDLIILSTPHGVCLTRSVGVYLGPAATGTALWNKCWGEFKVSIELDTERSDLLLNHLRDDGVPAEGILQYSGLSGVDTLRWGEAIPLWYMLRKMTKKPKFLIISQYREKGVSAGVDEQRLNVGRSLAGFINQLDDQLRVVVAISGDLSHIYEPDGCAPLYLPDLSAHFLYNSAVAKGYERATQGWIKSLPDFSRMDSDISLGPESPVWTAQEALPWLKKCGQLNPVARSCGMSGFVVLHALMEMLSQQKQGYTFKPRIETCQAPTYYGMLAATFQAQKN